MFSLNEILEALTGQQLTEKNRFFCEAVVDSRQAISGSMFVAIAGENTDGHQFIGEAFRRGALAALVQEDTSDKFTTVDLRTEKLPESFPPFPFCMRVDNTVEALQKTAAFHHRRSHRQTNPVPDCFSYTPCS